MAVFHVDPDVIEPDNHRMAELRPCAPADCEIKIYESKECVRRWRNSVARIDGIHCFKCDNRGPQ